MNILFYSARGEYGFLSNFYKSPIPCGQVVYPTAEHMFHVQKCLIFDSANTELLREMICAKTPAAVKKLGRKVRNFDEARWRDLRYQAMITVLRTKFADPDLRQKLIATGDAYLCEDSPTDAIWGRGPDGTGLNLLGKALMQVRAEL